MKISIFGLNYAPEMIGIATYTTGLAEGLAKRGHDVHVVTAVPYYPEWKVHPGWSGTPWKSRTCARGIKSIHCPIYVPRKPTGHKRILHYASFLLSSMPIAIGVGLFRRPQLVFTVAPSLLATLSALLTARICGAKTWIHVQDFEVEAAYATNLISPEGRLAKLANKFERWIFAKFDRVSSISTPMVAKAIEKGVPIERTYELRNWANLSEISPCDAKSPMRTELGITTKYVALYSGNLANKQGLEILPAVAKKLECRDDLTIVICGDGPMKDRLIQLSGAKQNIRFLPLQPRAKLNDLLGMADVHLLPQIAAATDLVLPSKLCNMLASGRPIIATAEPTSALGLEVQNAGIVTPPDDAQAMAMAILTLLDNDELRRNLGHAAFSRAQKMWEQEAILEKFTKTFLSIAELTSSPKTPAI